MSISLKLEKVLKPIEETADALSNLVVYPIYNDTLRIFVCAEMLELVLYAYLKITNFGS